MRAFLFGGFMPEIKIPSDVAHQLILDGLRALTTRVEALDKRLTGHMEEEEEIKRDLNTKIGQLSDLVRAMPHKNGEPDIYGHRNDHEEWRKIESRAQRIKWNLREKVIEWIVIGAIVLLASGKFSEIVNQVLIK